MDKYNISSQHRQLGEYAWQTWGETDEIVEALSRALIKKKLCPVTTSEVEGTPDLKFMGIFAENKLEWFMTELACCSHSVTVVPIAVENQFMYESRIVQILNSTELASICVSKKTIGVILDLKAQNKIAHLKNLILFDAAEDIHITLSTQVGLQMFSFDDLVSEGFRTQDIPKDEPTGDSILMLGITSGTTGEPKIAMLSHVNFISGQVCQDYLGFNYTEDDVYLSYVPLTHVYEQIMHIDAVLFGFRIGYSSGDVNNLISDVQFLQPTLFGSFPAFYNKLYDKMKENIESRTNIVQTVIDSAIQAKIWNFLMNGTVHHAVYDNLIFRPIRNILGGRIRFFVSGGAPMRVDVKNFITVVFSAPIFEAYGMTECSGCLSCTAVWDREGNNVGGVLPCCKMQLRDNHQLNFSVNSSPPTGEVYIKGNSVFKGYYKNPDLTRQTIDEDGWLRVGDIATLNRNGSITLIDRVHEMKKLQNGQFISPQKLETVYQEAPIISQICIDINSNYNFIAAVVVLNQDKLEQFASVNGFPFDVVRLSKIPDVEYAVLKQLERAAEVKQLS